MTPDPLLTALLDLIHELEGSGIPLILGGGYGLYLKQRHFEKNGIRTLLDPGAWPAPRATYDLDVFPPAEVVINALQMAKIAEALRHTGFVVIESKRCFQFERNPNTEQKVKVDLLVGPLPNNADRSTYIAEPWRVKPKPSEGVHARRTDEAIALESDTLRIPVDGALSTGATYVGTVLVPGAFPFLMMKLHAFRDCEKRRAGDDKARYHAIDLYRIVAMMTEVEFEAAGQLRRVHQERKCVGESTQIVREYFSAADSLGTIRLREHQHFTPALNVNEFIAVLGEVFAGPST